MDKLKFGIFDILTYTLPGLLILASLFMLQDNIDSHTSFVFSLKDKLDAYTGLIVIIIGYVVGMFNDSLGAFLYRIIGARIWKFSLNKKSSWNASEKYVVMREVSKENFKYIERWNMLKGLSHNIAAALLISVIVFAVKAYTTEYTGLWLGSAVFAFIGFWVFLKRASVFHQWAKIELENAIDVFKLEKLAPVFFQKPEGK